MFERIVQFISNHALDLLKFETSIFQFVFEAVCVFFFRPNFGFLYTNFPIRKFYSIFGDKPVSRLTQNSPFAEQQAVPGAVQSVSVLLLIAFARCWLQC